jgi:hypothetical protein
VVRVGVIVAVNVGEGVIGVEVNMAVGVAVRGFVVEVIVGCPGTVGSTVEVKTGRPNVGIAMG